MAGSLRAALAGISGYVISPYRGGEGAEGEILCEGEGERAGEL